MTDEAAVLALSSRDDGATTSSAPAGQVPPSRDDGATITCPVCQQVFARKGKRRWCSDACRAAAWRRRRQAVPPRLVLPPARPRRPVTVYECDRCGARAVGLQRCEECATFMRKLGLGGPCPHCLLTELRGPSRARTRASGGGQCWAGRGSSHPSTSAITCADRASSSSTSWRRRRAFSNQGP